MKIGRLHILIQSFAEAECSIKHKAPVIQYRNKNFSPQKHLHEVKKIVNSCKENKILCIINDYIELAKEVNADGVHLGITDCSLEKAVQLLPSHKIIGFTVHNETELQYCLKFRSRIHYIGVGSVFPSSSKKVKVIGIEGLKKICELSPFPVIAIGGIKNEHIPTLLKAGAYGVAILSEYSNAPNKCKKIQQLLNTIQKSLL